MQLAGRRSDRSLRLFCIATLVAVLIAGAAGGAPISSAGTRSEMGNPIAMHSTERATAAEKTAFARFVDVTGTIQIDGPPVTVTTTTANDNGELTFDGAAGQRVSLNVTAISYPTRLDVWIYNPSGSVLNHGWANAGASSSWFDAMTLPATGSYRIFIDPNGSGTGRATFSLYNVVDLSGSIATDGVPVTVTTTTPGQNGNYTFSGVTGENVTLNVTGISYPTRLDVWIKRPDSTVLSHGWANAGVTSTSFNSLALDQTGTYLIFLDPNGAGTGHATLTLGPPTCPNVAPIAYAVPRATLAADGNTITIDKGSWCNTDDFSFQWTRSTFVVPDASETEYSVGADDSGLTIYTRVTASNAYGATTVTSNGVPIPVSPDSCSPSAPPVITEPPTVFGDAEPTGTLTAALGTSTSCGSSIAGYTFQWLRDGSSIADATGQSYVVLPADAGRAISAQVVAYNATGASAPATSLSVAIGPDPGPDPPPVLGEHPAFTSTVDCFGSIDDTSCDGGQGSPPNFGGLIVRHEESPDIRGVRAGIQAPARNNFFLPYGNAAVMRISAEYFSSLAQTGFGRTEDSPVGACGDSPADGRLYTYYETKAPGITGQSVQECEFLEPVARGTSGLYTVYRVNTSRFGNDKTWQVNINGKFQTLRYLAFDAARLAVAGGEIRQRGILGVYGDGTVSGCYGCSATPLGLWNWQKTTVSGSVAWMNVLSAAPIAPPISTDGRWVVTGVQPGPFSVRHVCDPSHAYGC
jgi:hypothetical protein